MNHFKQIFPRLLLVLLIGCGTSDRNSVPKNDKSNCDSLTSYFIEVNDGFNAYLENFERSDLPITIRACNQSTKGLKSFDGKAFEQYNSDVSFAYKQFPTNGSFVATITLGVADCLLPVLTTYTSHGDKIDSKIIGIGQCGNSDCCKEFMMINKDCSFYASDTISNCNHGRAEEEIEVVYKKGKILQSGRIEIARTLTTQLARQ